MSDSAHIPVVYDTSASLQRFVKLADLIKKTWAKVQKRAEERMLFMSPEMSKTVLKAKSLVFKSAGLSAGVAILLSSGGAFAASGDTAGSQLLAQSQGGDVIIDTTNTGSSTPTTTTNSTNSGTRFTCQYTNGQYTVMYTPESRPGEAYPWATPTALGDGWTPQKRCEAISQRLETYRPDGLLEMQTGVQNRQNVVCVTTQQVGGCRIVLTVPPGKNAEVVRDQIFDNLLVADSGQATSAVNTFNGTGNNTLGGLFGSGSRGTTNTGVRRNRNINLRPFLDRADGGTATQFRNGLRRTAPAPAPSNNRRLTPGLFR